MMDKVKSCPFCGSEHISFRLVIPPTGFMQCKDCNAGSDIGNNYNEAIKAWNTRPDDEFVVLTGLNKMKKHIENTRPQIDEEIT